MLVLFQTTKYKLFIYHITKIKFDLKKNHKLNNNLKNELTIFNFTVHAYENLDKVFNDLIKIFDNCKKTYHSKTKFKI